MTRMGHDDASAAVHGLCAPPFERVRQALAEIVASRAEVGAAVAVYVDQHPVVDLWAGHTDAARMRPWERDTIVNLYSVGKAFTAVCALRLVEAGRLELDVPVARYWPEFAQAGKARIPLRDLRLTRRHYRPSTARCHRARGVTGTSSRRRWRPRRRGGSRAPGTDTTSSLRGS